MPEPASTTNFDSGAYCVTEKSVAAVKGSDILTCIFNADGTKLLAIDGETGAKISLSADTTNFTSKDTKQTWQINRPSTKSWTLDLDTATVKDSESDKALRKAFEDGTAICMKQVYDDTNYTPRCGGLAYVTKYENDAPADDNSTASISLTGTGKLTWFDLDTEAAAKATAKPSNRH